MPHNYTYVIDFSQSNKRTRKLRVWPISCPVTSPYCIGTVMFAEWKMIVIFVIVFEPFSWLLTITTSDPSSLNGVKNITNWDFKYSISCYMLISESLNMPNLLNNRKLQKHQIHCSLLCFDFHKCSIFRPKCTPWLKPSTSLQPFFLFSARSDCPSPEKFWPSIFHPPDIFISGKGQRPCFSEGLFIGSEQ